MEQEYGAHHRDNHKLLDQLVAQVLDGTLDQAQAIVGRYDLDPRRQSYLQRLELGFHRIDRLQGVLARAHHDYTAHHFALAVQLRDAASHLGPHLDARHVLEHDRSAAFAQADGDLAEVIQRL